MTYNRPAVPFKRTYTRKNGKKSVVWWYYVRDENGKRYRFSLGTGSKSEALVELQRRIRTDEIFPDKQKHLTFREYTQHFWKWDTCLYIRGKELRGETITKRWAHQNRVYLENHLLPILGDQQLANIHVYHVERLLFSLKEEKDLANKTLNQILYSLQTILEEALREGYIKENPCKRVRKLKETRTQRGILTPDEVKEVFKDPALWSHPVYYAMNITACTTGARRSELLALKVKKVLEDRIVIDSVIRRYEGFVEGDTKTGEKGFRIIPIPSRVSIILADLIKGRDPDDYVFSMDGSRPVPLNYPTEAFYEVLGKIEISDDARKKRHIDFHSWRHFFNSMLVRRQTHSNNLIETFSATSEAVPCFYSDDVHIREYQAALDDAFRKAPSGTTELVNLKGFKQVRLWPQVLGSILVTAGSAVASSFFTTGSIVVPFIASGSALIGAVFTGLNIYDFYLIGEPVVEDN